MVGAGAASTAATIEYCCEAQMLGADSVLVITPYYVCPTQDGVIHHFKAVSAACALPICVYNHPKRSGQPLTPETIHKLAAIPNVIGVKDASGDLSTAIEILAGVGPEFRLWSGDDLLTLPILAVGGFGVISVTSNTAPASMLNLVQTKNPRELYALLPLMRALFVESNPIPIKAAMQMCGKPSGGCRSPLTPLKEEHKSHLKHILERVSSLKSHAGV
jgi:4-hydroxy-tetrahydrodipicolinate synthase